MRARCYTKGNNSKGFMFFYIFVVAYIPAILKVCKNITLKVLAFMVVKVILCCVI